MSSFLPGQPNLFRHDVITFGETMLRLSPVEGQMLEQAEFLRVDAAGTESNTATALTRMGANVAWVSILPDNPTGHWITSQLSLHGVDTSYVVWSDKRVGVFFLESGMPPRGSRVVYDRAGSAATEITPHALERPLQAGARIVHTTGITASLGQSCLKTLTYVLRERDKREYRTSLDINYRAKLWTPQQANRVLTRLLGKVDILISTANDVAVIFGMEGPPEESIKKLRDRFKNEIIVLTLSEGGAVGWSEETGFLQTSPHLVEQVDRLGAGDAFDAGLLYGILQNDLEKGLLYGTALAAVSYSEQGDITWSTLDEIERMVSQHKVENR
tara:strand:+ start:2965 stop:3951 length:987 start_codon:yes stop_codon:yes gene_type:complete